MNHTDQARLLYSLLDAADGEDRLRDPDIAEKWRALKWRFDIGHSEHEHAALAALLNELDRTGGLAGTWIHARWLAANAQNADGRVKPERRRHRIDRHPR